jgi:hypothetical protein
MITFVQTVSLSHKKWKNGATTPSVTTLSLTIKHVTISINNTQHGNRNGTLSITTFY